jgi:hypothetical protein
MTIDYYTFTELDSISQQFAMTNTEKLIDLCLDDDTLSELFNILDCTDDDEVYRQHLIFDFEGAIIGPINWLSEENHAKGTISVDGVYLFLGDKPHKITGDEMTFRYEIRKQQMS